MPKRCKIEYDVRLNKMPVILKEALDWFDDHNFSDFDFRDDIKNLTLNQIKEDEGQHYNELMRRIKKRCK